MKLVICEKPSVAKSIASALGVTSRADGYFEGGGWLISWCIGHLVGLADAAAYDDRYKKWRYEDLPILPAPFRYVVSEEKAAQFHILRSLMERPDVTELVNACDAGREGELIFRLVYEAAGCSKSFSRLWISSMEDAAIREGFADLRPGKDYDPLYQSALCRQKADWLIGINASRLFSVLYHRTLNVGRVQTPTLAMLADRDGKIVLFRKEKYHHVRLALEGTEAVSEKIPAMEDAQAIRDACDGQQAVCVSLVREKKTEKPAKLYDLTTLQREANRVFGYTAKQTLDYAQSLYEKKLLTYPRTDSRYLTGDMAETASVVLHLAARVPPFDACPEFFPDVLALVNDKEVSDHHALIPTLELEKADVPGLPVGERNILLLACCKLLCAAAEPFVYEAVTATFDCGGHTFTTKGKQVLSQGWRAIQEMFRSSLKEKPEDEDAEGVLPALTEGQVFESVAASVTEHFTSPPKPYTEDTLLSAMETAGKEDMPEDAERKGLGTPATRAGILEKLVSAGFLERKKNRKTVQLLPSHDAVSLITVLPEQLQSPLLTAEWEYRLGEIERGQLAPEEFLDGISTMLKDLVGTYQVIKGTEYLFTPPREVVGKCPRCGGEVAELQKGFFCQNDSCKFAIWKNNKWWAAKKKQPTKAVVSALLNDGRVRVTGLYSEKTGKTYDATVVLEDDGQYANFKLEFDQRKGGSR